MHEETTSDRATDSRVRTKRMKKNIMECIVNRFRFVSNQYGTKQLVLKTLWSTARNTDVNGSGSLLELSTR